MNLNNTILRNMIISAASLFIFPDIAGCQTFSWIYATGFNHDVIAEAGNSSLATTTISLDAAPASNKVMYTETFKALNSFGGGGLPDNRLITTASGTYKLASYDGNNALVLQRGQNGYLNIESSRYYYLRVLCFSTEGTSLVNVTLHFTDGTQKAALTNYPLGNWFNNTTNIVLSGFGRCTRATPASGADGYPDNPRMYYMDIPLSCADRAKFIDSINFANVTTGGANAPYPNAVFMGVSGVTVGFDGLTTNATCNSNGQITFTPNNIVSPYSIVWNTNPVQTGNTAINLPPVLAPSYYEASVTDGNGCLFTYQFSLGIVGGNPVIINRRTDTCISAGSSFNPNMDISNANEYAWSPTNGVSNPAIANPVLSPATTTTYKITASRGINCSRTDSFKVIVGTNVAVTAGNDQTINQGQSVQLQGSGPQGTYLWTPPAGLSATNILNPIANPTVSTTYTLQVTTAQGCIASDKVDIIVVPDCIKPMEAFTPNGDGINDRWQVTSSSCPGTISVHVYNRYGSLVYLNKDYKNDWEGKYKGKPLPDATYYYVIDYKLQGGRTALVKGNCTILR